MKNLAFLILNGELVKESEARISPVNRGMMYGDGCFETFKSYKGKFLCWEDHFERLSGGLKYLDIENHFTSDSLKKETIRLLEKNKLSQVDALIRVQCWREGIRGYKSASTKMSWMIQTGEVQSNIPSVKLTLAETRCIPSVALDRRYKLSNGLNFIKATQEAKLKNTDDALMLTIEGLISESTSANVFWIHGGNVFTASEECDLLPGITRKVLMEIMQRNGISIQTGKFSIDHFRHAEAAFCCNSVQEIQVIKYLDNIAFEKDHPLVKKIMVLFDTHKLHLLKA